MQSIKRKHQQQRQRHKQHCCSPGTRRLPSQLHPLTAGFAVHMNAIEAQNARHASQQQQQLLEKFVRINKNVIVYLIRRYYDPSSPYYIKI